MNRCIKWALAGLLVKILLHCSNLWAVQPDLVLMITVDQLRGDFPGRIGDRLAPSGFRYLFDHGAVYLNAHYSHLVTMTSAGHATLVTGAGAPQHGIVGNEWFDVETRQVMYSTQDSGHPVLGAAAAPSEGRSPRNLLAPTIADALVAGSGGKSRVFSASVKDRGAIIPAGQSGKAFWYSRDSGRFVTSNYYYPKYPDWVDRWNQAGQAEQFRNQHWQLLLDRDRYVFRDQDDRGFERPEGLLGRTFPHPLGNSDSRAFYSSLRVTPMADQLLLSFVKSWVEAENIGGGGRTDLLAVSFSATDYIGHAFGPDSLEAEDNLLRLDRTLQDLFAFIDERVGLENTLVVLSSDHGIAPPPERMRQLGVDAAWHQPREIILTANRALRDRFGGETDLALAFLKPGIYLDEAAIEDMGLDLREVERALAGEILKLPGFSSAFSRGDLLSGSLPASPLVNTAALSTHPVRSGNVIIVQDPFWLLSSAPEEDSSTHGSPYAYDTHVPIMLAGPGIRRQKNNTPVSPRDVAPTVCAILEISPPRAATGHPLPGILPN